MVYAINLADPAVNPGAKFTSISTLINIIIPLLMTGAGILFLIMLMLGAFTYLTSAGQQEKLKKAGQTFTYAILGLVIIVSSYILVKIIGIVLKVDIPL